MKNKSIIICIILVILLSIITGIIINKNNKKSDDNTLYTASFENTIIRIERYDYSLGQNQIVGVEKSTNKGKSYEKLTKETLTVSKEPKFVFLDENLGFVISKPNLNKSNNYIGIKVTHDGGKTFNTSQIKYENPNIEILTIEDAPFYENEKLKLHCSIYQIKSDDSGYENVDLYFTTNDNGLTWNLEND